MTSVLSRGIASSLFVLVCTGAIAQDAPEGTLTGWHIVRPGDTLIGLTAKYLGTSERWRENLALNPQIANPDVLQPGSRLRVLLDYDSAPPVARVKGLSGLVEERPVPIPWKQAEEQDLLVERDGLRTHRNSSSELEFRDGTNLVLSEESLVFVRPSKRAPSGPIRRSVEIVEGQAEVQALRPDTPSADVEILVGSATATATRTPDGLSQARARKAVDGTAQVMVYEGAGEVEAAGQAVAVPRGMGTAVPEDAPPSPPEELLPAPVPLEPAAGSEWRFGQPRFAWEPVADAASHTLEICTDAACNELFRRAVALTGFDWRPDPLPVGEFYWRVTAVAGSGLDGYPSVPLPFTILVTGADTSPPTGGVSVSGRTATHEGVTYYEPGARIEAEMADDQSGLEIWGVQVDGQEPGAGGLAGPWTTGSHTARAIGFDRAGNRGESEPVSFEVDADGPAIELRLAGRELLEEKLGTGSVPKKWCKRKKKWIKRHTRPSSGRRPVWTLIAAGSDASPIADSYDADRILRLRQRTDVHAEVAGDNPGILLLAAGRLEIEGNAVRLPDGGDLSYCRPAGPGGPGYEKNALLWVGASDALSGRVTSLSIGTESRSGAGQDSDTFLLIGAEDLVGNVRQVSIKFRPLASDP